jgi:hypothetical protein
MQLSLMSNEKASTEKSEMGQKPWENHETQPLTFILLVDRWKAVLFPLASLPPDPSQIEGD